MVLYSQCQENESIMMLNSRTKENEDECMYTMEFYSALNINKSNKMNGTGNVVLVRQLKLIKTDAVCMCSLKCRY